MEDEGRQHSNSSNSRARRGRLCDRVISPERMNALSEPMSALPEKHDNIDFSGVEAGDQEGDK